VTDENEKPPLTTVFVADRAEKRRLERARLTIVEGESKGKELVIERERVTVGRSVICDLVLADKAVSGTHFEIVASDRGFLLRDLDSTNGTLCRSSEGGGELRVREVWVKPGMVIRAGQTQLRFELGKGTVEIDLSKSERFHELVGKGVRMREIFATLEKVAPTELTVLVRGETGTGKELVARALHKSSRRRAGPLVVQDCSAIPKDLIESTLFGHERGSFTGATERHRGSFEQADGGTIFLDEIGELDLSLQPKLLRVLENREIKRVGGDRAIPVNVRVVAATNRDLRQMVNDGTFREDLYYRLGVVTVELPSLRERSEDVPLLVEHFLEDFAARRWPGEERKLTVAKDAMTRLTQYAWPGNVRELKNTIERGASLADGTELTLRDLLPSSQKTPPVALPGGDAEQFVADAMPFKEAKQRVLDVFEAAYLKALLDKHGGNITRSAQAAGLTRYHLRELAKRYGVRDTAPDDD
jgi:DNA-binding NtrC family response regulator